MRAVKPIKSTVDDQIDVNLKRAFDKAASEPLPDTFLSLLADLKATEKQKVTAHAD